MITRKINWVSSLNERNRDNINHLEKRLVDFYSQDGDYWEENEVTLQHWVNGNEKAYMKILDYCNAAKSICEFGCGKSNILKFHGHLHSKYSGCDFSEAVINSNKKNYPGARFKIIEVPNQLPFENQEFDLVFSVFVMEHCCRPDLVLQECKRLLSVGGRLVLLCPNFLGRGRMASQRAGLSEGTSKSKLTKGRYLDAALTLYDNRIKIPLYCWWQRLNANRSPRFLINISPVVFEDTFIPDVDAVYLTYKNEIIRYLSDEFEVEENSDDLKKYEKERALIFLSLKKVR